MRRVFPIALLALASCGQDPTVVTPATFERPGAIDFVCVDTEVSELVVRSLCEGVTGTTDDRYALVGLVTQTASGEVGAIDFRVGRVIDADWRVPGFTFTRVGELPSAIAVDPDEPGVTYVAAYGSRTVEYYPTGIFLGGSVPTAEVQGEVNLPAGPTDLVLAPGMSVAYVTLPSIGAIVPIPIQADRSLAPVDMSAAIVPTVPAELPAPVAGAPTTYEYACVPDEEAALGVPDPARVRTEILAAGETSEPHRLLLVDDGAGAAELLVADRQLPLIHRFSVEADGSLTELEPLAPGAPVRDLAVSPVVPKSLPGSGAGQNARYLYAIDDTDQSVLVMDYDEASATFGAVLPVSFGLEESDRLRLAGKATALDVVVRDYDPAEPEYCATPSDDQGPVDLRGVFLAVGLANGGMQLVDVVDLDAPCRGFSCTPEGTPAPDVDGYVYIQRHRPRISDYIASGVETLGSPVFSVDGVGRLGDEAEAIDGLLPVLGDGEDPVAECPFGQRFVYGELVCATADPWALRPERWTATYEGTIPGTTQLARVEGSLPTFEFVVTEGLTPFCERGVLGAADLRGLDPELDPEAGYVGDTLVITTEPAEAMRSIAACEPYFETDDGAEREQVELPIFAAREDRLVVDLRFGGDIDDFMTCYLGSAEFVGVSVRLEQAFLVSGAETGFLHRVVASGPDGACRVDTAGQPIDPADPTTYRNGRALNGRVVDAELEPAPYQNPFIAFTLDAVGVNETAQLQINLTGTPSLFVVPVGARPGRATVITIVQDVVYSPVDERLYVLDSNASSLVQYEVAEFQVENVFE